jgi:hypothetical protein
MGTENSKEMNKNEMNYNYTELFKKYSPYKILGVSETDSIEVIVKKYRSLCKIHHPDKGGDIKKFNLIKEAFTYVNLVHENREFSHDRVKQRFQKDKENIDSNVQNIFMNKKEHEKNSRTVDEKIGIERQNFDCGESSNLNSNGNGNAIDRKNNRDTINNRLDENRVIYEDENDFMKKFNMRFENNYIPNENQSYGYGNLDWSKYDNKKPSYEIIPYEMINFNYSKNTNCEEFESTNKGDYSKYPNICDKDLSYTDFMHAYTTSSTLLPDDHEVIWNQYFQDYHNRDMKKIEKQREEKPFLTEKEIELNNKRLEQMEENERQRQSNWNNWVEKQRLHYEKCNVVSIKNN